LTFGRKSDTLTITPVVHTAATVKTLKLASSLHTWLCGSQYLVQLDIFAVLITNCLKARDCFIRLLSWFTYHHGLTTHSLSCTVGASPSSLLTGGMIVCVACSRLDMINVLYSGRTLYVWSLNVVLTCVNVLGVCRWVKMWLKYPICSYAVVRHFGCVQPSTFCVIALQCG